MNMSLVRKQFPFGKQALIAVLPYRATSSKIEYYHCRLNRYCPCDSNFINQFSNEILLYNTLTNIATCFYTNNIFRDTSKVILSGGINRGINKN